MNENEYKARVRQCWSIIPIFFIIVFVIDITRGLYFDTLSAWFIHEHNEVLFYKWGPFLAFIATMQLWIQLLNGRTFRWVIFFISCFWLILFIIGPLYEYFSKIIPIYIVEIMVFHDIVTAFVVFNSFKWAKMA